MDSSGSGVALVAATAPMKNEPRGHVGAEHRLVLASVGRGAFSVAFLGEVIVEGSHAPEQDAALVLYNRGINGRAVTFHDGSNTRCLRFDISKLAEAAIKRREDVAARLRA